VGGGDLHRQNEPIPSPFSGQTKKKTMRNQGLRVARRITRSEKTGATRELYIEGMFGDSLPNWGKRGPPEEIANNIKRERGIPEKVNEFGKGLGNVSFWRLAEGEKNWKVLR